jgi:prepilin-type N-terminal cleavage/methylation domain-containing protein
MKTKRNFQRRLAFSLTELMIVIAIIALLTTLAVPNFARARDNSPLNLIYGDLRVLDAAKDQWAMTTTSPPARRCPI